MRKFVISIVLLALILAGCAPAGVPGQVQPTAEPVSPQTDPTVSATETAPPTSSGTPTESGTPTASVTSTAVETETGQPVGGTITRALASEPPSLDPGGMAGAGQNAVLPYLFDTLVYRDTDNSYRPYLAREWTVSDDGKTVTFFLKPGVTFHDGTPLNAEAVKFTYERVMVEGSRSPLTSGLANVEEIEVAAEDQVVFTLKQPSSTLLSTLSTAYAGIVSPTAAAESGEQFGLQPVGSGSFMLDSWQQGEAVTLIRNPDYTWGPEIVQNEGAPYLEKLVFKTIPDASSQLTAFQTGEVDMLFINQPSQIAALSSDPSAELVETTLNSLIYLGFNLRAEPFGDPLVRRAIAHAIDKQEMVQLALGGVGQAAFSPLAATLPGFDPSLKELEPSYDLQQSAALLEEAGFTRQADGNWVSGDSGEPLTLEILTSTRPPNEALATVLQDQLKEAGIPVTIRALESTAASDLATQGDYQAILWRYDWNDADVLNVYLSSERMGRTNRSFYSNPEVDRLLNEAAQELDQTRRNELYSQAQAILIEEQPWIPLYTPKDYIVMRTTIQGAVVGPLGRVILNDAWLQP